MKILLIFALLAFGCVGVEQMVPTITEEPIKKQDCKTIFEMEPVTTEECGDVSYTEEVCERRELEYNISLLPISHICSLSDNGCSGKVLATCASCTKAVTRCEMTITNLDPKKSGDWTVGATFISGKATFSREPLTKNIDPLESEKFDFQQFYDPGTPINSAECKLFVSDIPIVDDCKGVTKTRRDCTNVTTMIQVSKEICN